MRSHLGRVRGMLPLALLALGCGRRDSSPTDDRATAAQPPIALAFVDMDCFRTPCGDRPFVAGEALRIEVRASGGVRPYRLEIAVEDESGHRAASFGETSTGPESGAGAVSIAARIDLPARLPGGSFRIIGSVRDRNDRSATIESDPVEVVGDDAPTIDPDRTDTSVRVVDAGQRQRASFERAERVEVRVRAAEITGDAAMVLESPTGERLATTELPAATGDERVLAFDIPRLALPGTYTVRVTGGGQALTTPLVVGGTPFPPMARLAIDSLSITGGEDGRSPRSAILVRGQPLAIEARVGGHQTDVGAVVRLRDAGGRIAHEIDLGTRRPAQLHATARVYVSGSITLPTSLAAGNYMLELEVTSDDQISARHRRVVLR